MYKQLLDKLKILTGLSRHFGRSRVGCSGAARNFVRGGYCWISVASVVARVWI